MDTDKQQQVAEFCSITGADPQSAQGALESADWNLSEAVNLYFAAHDEPQAQGQDDDFEYDEPAAPAPQSAFADPTPAQPSAAPSSSSSKPTRNTAGGRPKQMTMDELRKRNEERDDDSEDENKPGPDMFAGGEKSGLAVQNPGQSRPPDHFRNIMNQARQNRDRPAGSGEEPDDQPQRSSNFSGRAQTLGGDEAESEVVEDPLAPPPASGRTLERVSRTLHLWADGVSIDDGPLFRFDDPANQAIMAEINRGRAPLQLLDVQPDQEVDLNLEPHKDENFVQPKKKYKPFGGSGQRLGSPTPSAPSAFATTATPAATAAATSSSTPAGSTDVDESQPTVQLRIQLGDGTRMTSRFNTTHTIGDVYGFVDRARPESAQRPYALMTTFPSKELDDRSVVLGDMAEFKRGGVVVQKWK